MKILGLLLLLPLLSLALPGKYITADVLNDIKLPNPLDKIEKISTEKDCRNICIKHDNCTGYAISTFERICEIYQITPGSQNIPRSGSRLYIREKEEDSGQKTFGTTYIKLITKRMSFADATRACSTLHGYLVAIKSEELNDLLVEMAKERNVFFAFIGTSDQITEEVWKYVDGSNDVASYDNFGLDGYWYRRDRNCVMLRNNGKWYQMSCEALLASFCQIPMF